MSFSDSGTFIAWDPLRPQKSPICMACGAAPQTPYKCGGCHFAHFCGRQCQEAAAHTHADACKRGYASYVESLEQHTRLVGKQQKEGAGHEKCMATYERALAAAKAIGDGEGQRHLHKVIAFRLDAHGERERAAQHEAAAARIESIIGKPAGARRIFEGVQETKLNPLGAPSRGGPGRTRWCEWEQTASDLTATVALPEGTRKQAISVSFEPRRLSVKLVGGVTIAEGELCGAVQPSECSWLISSGQLVLTLEKTQPGAWAAPLIDDRADAAAPATAPLAPPPTPPDADAVQRLFAQLSAEPDLGLGPPLPAAAPPPLPSTSPRDVIGR
jgi:hypothetical protein